MRRNAYGGYRGRRTGRDILKLLIALLLVLVVVLAGIAFFGRDQLGLPEQPESSQSDPTPAPEQPEQMPEPAPEPEPEPEPAPAQKPEVMAAVEISLEQLLDGSWSQVVEQSGGNAVVVNMKPDDGALNWVSAQEMAAAAKANSSVENVNEGIRQANADDLYSVARVSCFRDNSITGSKDYCIRSNSDYRWKDFGGVYWASVTVPEVQDYMVALAVELAELGFDEILLDHCGYPQDGTGEMGWIKRGAAYDLDNLDTVVSQFLEKLTAALEPYEVVLSIRTDASILAEDGDKTGVTGAVLDRYADRIWMNGEGIALPAADLLEQAGVSRAEERVVLQVNQLDGEESARAQLNF